MNSITRALLYSVVFSALCTAPAKAASENLMDPFAQPQSRTFSTTSRVFEENPSEIFTGAETPEEKSPAQSAETGSNPLEIAPAPKAFFGAVLAILFAAIAVILVLSFVRRRKFH